MSDAWQSFTAFQVFADHVPVAGSAMMLRLIPDIPSMATCLSARAPNADPLDPEFTQMVIRAGLALAQVDGVSLVYSSGLEACVVIETDRVQMVGQSLLIHDFLVSRYAARLAVLSGMEIAVSGTLYEFPTHAVVRKALGASLAGVVSSAPWRAAFYVGSQVMGRGGDFDPASIQTLDGQKGILEAAGVDLEALPAWWSRGLAARSNEDVVELFDQLNDPDALANLVAEPGA
jgi:hypothetical protein